MAGASSTGPGFLLEVERERHVYEARLQARELAERLGFGPYDLAAIETAVAELATNIVRHAGRGLLVVRPRPDAASPAALEIVARNLMPSSARQAQHPEGREGLGIGLSGVRRLMDEVRVEHLEDGALQVTAAKWLPGRSPPVLFEPIGVIDVSARYRVEAAARPSPVGRVSADGYVVKEQDGRLVAALVDALGHGLEAAEVTRLAKEVLLGDLHLEPHELVQRLHQALRGTRGACVAVASVTADGRLVSWAGVGNVRLRVWHGARATPVYLPVRPGIVGYSAPRVETHSVPVECPASLLMVTDGIQEEALDERPDDAASVVQRFSRPNDDATALFIRWG